MLFKRGLPPSYLCLPQKRTARVAWQTRPRAAFWDPDVATEKPPARGSPILLGGDLSPSVAIPVRVSTSFFHFIPSLTARGHWGLLLFENFLACSFTIITNYVYAIMSGGRGRETGYAIVYMARPQRDKTKTIHAKTGRKH